MTVTEVAATELPKWLAMQADFTQMLRAINQLIDTHAGTGMESNMHIDDMAVTHFAGQMRARIRDCRERGKQGWQDCGQVSTDALTRLLFAALLKGSTVDVANYAMMLSHRGAEPEAIAHTLRPYPQCLHLAEQILNPEGLGFAASAHVRDAARSALGMPTVEAGRATTRDPADLRHLAGD